MKKIGGIVMYTYEDVSKELGIHYQTVSKMVVNERIRAVRIGKRNWISFPSLRDFVNGIK